MKQNSRLCIYPKDIVRITGRGEKYARQLLSKIKISLSKGEHQFITINEFCEYTGLPIEDVNPLIID